MNLSSTFDSLGATLEMKRTTRRCALLFSAVLLGASGWGRILSAAEAGEFQLATFTADVTPPLGHPLLGGHLKPARTIDDPLFAKGLVLLGPDEPILFVADQAALSMRRRQYAREG